MLSCTGVLVVGVTSVAGERERERERKRGLGLEASSLGLPLPRLSYSACHRSFVSCARVFVHRALVSPPLLSPWGPGHPLLYKEMPSCTMGV
jgi:hypothetical protein